MKKHHNDIIITKASGNIENFSEDKLRSSLQRAGADEKQIDDIINEISDKIYQGISTKKIYSWAFSSLKNKSRHVASRYHLKRGIMELGPTGFPFERYVGALLKAQGYTIKIGEIVKGQCVDHEVDVIAEKGNDHFMVECKYHNRQGMICDVKIPLYIQSRFKDIETQWIKLPGHETKFHQGWIITNTRFSADAVRYGICQHLNLISWDFPERGNLRDQIDALGLYPITCLTLLSKDEKLKLLDKNIILCRDLAQNRKLLEETGVHAPRLDNILHEAEKLCLRPVGVK